MTDMMLRGPVTDEQGEYLQMVQDSSRSLLTIINDLLDFSRVEARRLDLREEDFNLYAHLERVVSGFAVEAAKKSLRLDLDFHPDTPRRLRGDPGRLAQVVRNLLSNALKFTDQGGVRVRVQPMPAKKLDMPGISVQVADTGIGIPEDMHEEIFKSFIQVDDSYTRRHQGAGLGLAICRELVRMMGGEIRVRSEPGAGAEFTFTAFFQPGSPQREADAVPAGDLAKEQAGQGGRRVLLAEDNPLNRKFVAHRLAEAGHQVVTAENGREAVEAVERDGFDIVFMDVQMPEMDGVEAVRRIRELEQRSGRAPVPIVALTAYAMQGDRERFLAAGMDHYLAKPVDQRALLELAANAHVAPQPDPEDQEPEPGQAEAGAEPPLLDEKTLQAAFAGRGELLAEMVGLFASNMAGLGPELKDRLDAGEFDEAAETAHSLVNSAGAVRSPWLAEKAKRLEQAARDRRRAECLAVAQDVNAGAPRLLERLGLVVERLTRENQGV
jgi:CheY-like chemotaxis protein